MKHLLVNRDTLDGVSGTFEITNQITIHAQGLEPGDEVTIWLVQLTDPTLDPCSCPPGRVELPSVLDETQLLCCDIPVTLTRERPFVVLNEPQGIHLRVKLALVGAHSTQRVYYVHSNTQNVNDRLRGCPCASAGA